MKEIDIHRWIEQQDKEKKDALYEKLQSKLDLAPRQETMQVAQQPKKKSRVLILASAACLCIVCVAIMLPFLLKSKTDNTPRDRYCEQKDYVMVSSDKTIKEYAIFANKQMLYIDWYALAEDITTNLYVSVNDPNDMIFIKETLVNGETGDTVSLFITDIYTKVDTLAWFEDACINTYDTHNITVQWAYGKQSSSAMFSYKDFRYYIELRDPIDENAIKEIIEGMFVE